MEQRTGTAATIGIIGAILGIVVIFAGHPVWGLIIELGAVLAGTVGLIMAASPRVGGGVLSIVAIVIALFGVGFSVLGMIGALIF